MRTETWWVNVPGEGPAPSRQAVREWMGVEPTRAASAAPLRRF
jgi:hypothetical protein